MTGKIFALCTFAAYQVVAAPWFDAEVSEYEVWPSDGADKVLVGVGTWSGTGSARLVSSDGGSRLDVDTDSANPLDFGVAVTKSIADDMPSIHRRSALF